MQEAQEEVTGRIFDTRSPQQFWNTAEKVYYDNRESNSLKLKNSKKTIASLIEQLA